MQVSMCCISRAALCEHRQICKFGVLVMMLSSHQSLGPVKTEGSLMAESAWPWDGDYRPNESKTKLDM